MDSHARSSRRNFLFACSSSLHGTKPITTEKERAAGRAAHIAGFGRHHVLSGDGCERTPMSTLTKPIQPDRSKIDLQNGRHVRAWSRKLNVSPIELQKVVETVGNSAAEVKKELGRPKR
jgi:Protein of unknown function (DUF3606)